MIRLYFEFTTFRDPWAILFPLHHHADTPLNPAVGVNVCVKTTRGGSETVCKTTGSDGITAVFKIGRQGVNHQWKGYIEGVHQVSGAVLCYTAWGPPYLFESAWAGWGTSYEYTGVGCN